MPSADLNAARDKSLRLLNLLRGVREAKPDARDFALFDRRDDLAALGVPHAQIDSFDARDDAALDRHIADAGAAARRLGAVDASDPDLLFGDSGQDVLRGGDDGDALTVSAAKPPPANPLLPVTPWPKNGPTWQPYQGTKGILPAPPPALPKAPTAPQIDPRVRVLLDTIAAGEVDEAKAKASGFSSAYDTPYGYGQFGKPPKPLTQMTLGEIKAFQRQTVNNQQGRSLRSSAMGRYQFMPKTLPDIQKSTGLTDADVFGPAVQEQMALDRLKKRGLDKYLAGHLRPEDFQDNLASEWASIGMAKSGKSAHNQPVGTPAEKARRAILNLKRP
jgi:hypothetical protein